MDTKAHDERQQKQAMMIVKTNTTKFISQEGKKVSTEPQLVSYDTRDRFEAGSSSLCDCFAVADNALARRCSNVM